uniref:Uncharacterized protein n=1 Tax=Musa acuminata subsp. malaccensis TaxID=214687 RepID=A0A804L0U1_MUSAM
MRAYASNLKPLYVERQLELILDAWDFILVYAPRQML